MTYEDRWGSLWDLKFKRVDKFIKRGSGYPSQHSKDPEEQTLGTWVVKQRRDYKARTLPEERISMLEGLPDWSWNPYDVIWRATYNELSRRLKRGSGYPQFNSIYPKERALYGWTSKQRRAYKKGVMPEQRRYMLEDLPKWRWTIL